jgi:uncharacterized protein YeaO (DUF488 family)
MIQIKRVYEVPEKGDGYRVLVDRLWPRGLTKEKAKIDLWLKEIAPSDALRKWFGHDPKRWEEFERRYGLELQANDGLLAPIRTKARAGAVTLLYGVKDEQHNNAVVLSAYLRSKRKG